MLDKFLVNPMADELEEVNWPESSEWRDILFYAHFAKDRGFFADFSFELILNVDQNIFRFPVLRVTIALILH